MEKSLWGEEFDVKDDVASIVKKSKSKVRDDLSIDKLVKSKSIDITDKLTAIKSEVYRILGKHADDTQTIKSEKEFIDYIDKVIDIGGVAIDTETNNTLDTYNCKIMGLCLYAPGLQNAYVPVHHIDRLSGTRYPWQITEQCIKEQLGRLENVFKVFHNAVFDIKVIYYTCGIRLHADWDTSIAASIIDENELKSLKTQYMLHIDSEHEKYDIEHLFQGLPYEVIDPELFALYAATDSRMTWDLFEWQRNVLRTDDMKDVYSLYREVEIPVIEAVVDMELNGVSIDLDYANKMSVEYTRRSNEAQAEIDEELKRLQPDIDAWRLTKDANDKPVGKNGKPGKSKNEQFKNPPELSSPTQLAILLYDILKVDVLDKSAPRGTGADILEELAYSHKICELIIKKRGIDILLNTFIDKMPEIIKSDGKVHAGFNQYGAKTGRFSSSEPNLQNIPSHDKLVRMMFKGSEEFRNVNSDDNILIIKYIEEVETVEGWKFAKDLVAEDILVSNEDKCTVDSIIVQGDTVSIKVNHDISIVAKTRYVICGNDYSGQEPRALCSFAKDARMKQAYEDNRDLYAEIGSACFKVSYEDCLEFDPRNGGKLNPEGKERRSKSKSVLLGILYGMSARSLALRIGMTQKEAEQIISDFYAGFPGIKKFTDESQSMLKDKGYITDIYGRRRHIPDGALPEYEVTYIGADTSFNPMIGAVPHNDNHVKMLVSKYKDLISKARFKRDKDNIVNAALKDNIRIRNNNGFISRALRQCLNARIQGSASSITKNAMAMIHNDKKLNDLGFRLLITVHDELIGEAPLVYAKEATDRLCEVMLAAANVKCSYTTWKADGYSLSHWYLDECEGLVLKEFNKSKKDKESAIDDICAKYPMLAKESIEKVIDGTFDELCESLN